MKKTKKWLSLLVAAMMALQPLTIHGAAAAEDDVSPPEAWGPLPTETQLQYHEEELSAFIHFGVNTFYGVEWGTGKEDPNVFHPTGLDTDQWVKTLKDAGFKRIIMIGRHHDGFCLWDSEYTTQDVASSTDFQATQAARGQSGDVLEELSKSCTKYDMDMGFYLSPWDANNPSYGYGTGTDEETDSNGDYNEYYMNQLREVLGNPKYGNDGKFVEVWMDGAKGSGAAAQHYKFQEWFDLIEELQPGAVVFSPYGSTIRWIGNESGKAGDPCWSKLDQQRQRDYYDTYGGDEANYLNSGDPNGDIWSIGECDVSLTSGWFWKAGKQPKSMEELTDIYFKSVGRGQPLLLNVPPDTTGVLPEDFVDRVSELGETIRDTFRTDLTKQEGVTAEATAVRGNSPTYAAANVLDDDSDSYWTMDDGQTTGSITIDLGGTKLFDIVSIEEYIELGQRISDFTVDVHTSSGWKEFGSGHTIGAKRLVRGAPVRADQIRVNITGSQAVPLIENIGAFKAEGAFEQESIMPEGLSMIDDREFDRSDGWNLETIDGVNDTGMWANPGAEASFTFTGTKAWIVGTKDPNHGTMDVYVDGNLVATPDAYQPNRQLKQILYVTDDLPYGEHTVRMVCKTKATGLDAAFILDNNGAGMFEIDPASYTVLEGGTQNIVIKRVGGTSGEVSVDFQTAPDTAVHGRHYNDVNETVTFADGQDTAEVTVEAIENNEVTGDLRFFAEIVNPAGGAILGFNTRADVIIKDNDLVDKNALKAALEKANAENEGWYTSATWMSFVQAREEAQAVYDNSDATAEQVNTALENLEQAQKGLEDRTAFTEADPFILPKENEGDKLAEAEFFTLVPISGDKYVRIEEDANASHGQKVGWMEPGNVIKLPYVAPNAGTYRVDCRYQSGRLSEETANVINWSGDGIQSGSVRVFGDSSAPYKNVTFDLIVTEPGAGELVITADSNAGPNLDFFTFTAKDLVANTYIITAEAGENGSIEPSGEIAVKEGSSQTFTITPDRGYEIAEILVDGEPADKKSTYTFEEVTGNHTISVSFQEMDHYGENRPVVLNSSTTPVEVEAELLELGGEGGLIEDNAYASGGKAVGWLGNCGDHGNAWLNLWVEVPQDGTYDIAVSCMAGAQNILYYENLDQTVQGRISCENTYPNFVEKTIRVELKQGIDRLKFFNDEESTANLDKFTITAVQPKLTVVSVKNPEKQTVVSGTLFEDLDLPETVTVVLSDGSTEKAGVVWEKDGYLPEVGTYTISGILTLPDGVENPENLQAEATVVVEEQELSPHLFFVQWNANAELEVEGNVNEVILERDGIFSAEVMAGEDLKLHFTPVGQSFNAVTCNGETIPFEADGFTYSVTMQNQDTKLYFHFVVVNKAILEAALDVANTVTEEELEDLADTVKQNFLEARENAQEVFDKDTATQAEVNEAWKLLIEAIHYLDFEKGDLTSLGKLLEIASKIDPELFTESSYEGFEEAYQTAQDVYDLGGDALKGDVENAYYTLEEALNRLIFKADLSSLQAVVDYAKSLCLEDYRSEGQKEFQEALTKAETILEKGAGAVTQEKADAAAAALTKAIENLRRIPDKDALEDLIAQVENMDLSNYTAASVRALNGALQSAREVVKDPQATRDQIVKAYDEVEDRVEQLETKKQNGSHSGGSSSSSSAGNSYGVGTAPATTVPVLPTENCQTQVFVVSDTTLPFTLKRGSAYCFKMTVNGSMTAVPSFTVGNGDVLKTQFVAKVGNDYYFRVWAIGTPGTSTGVYTTLPGQNAQLHCTVTVG